MKWLKWAILFHTAEFFPQLLDVRIDPTLELYASSNEKQGRDESVRDGYYR